ncbi:MAG: hypothetical protein NT070_17505 [Cyanobacteria bacterium]|nr:hypothetical protein [Cyanobacteriota bacterium]
MNLILHEAPRLLANILILQPIDERYIWMPTTAILGEPNVFRMVSFAIGVLTVLRYKLKCPQIITMQPFKR